MPIPFDITAPISSIVTLLMGCFVITLAISLSSFLVAQRIEIKRIFLLSLLAYLLTPIIVYFISPLLFGILHYLPPIVVWVVFSEILLEEIDMKKRAIIAVFGYVIFLLFSYMGIWSIIYSLIPF